MLKEKTIELTWNGPFTLDEDNDVFQEYEENFNEYGIYQIYGTHPIYGNDTLLYIGKAEKQTFGKRLKQEIDNDYPWYIRTGGEVEVYLAEIEECVSDIENLLIYAHMPACNSQSIKNPSLDNLRIYNYGYYHRLFPEVSTQRYIG